MEDTHYHVNLNPADRFTPEQLELFRRVVKQIEHEPERWHQDSWVWNPVFEEDSSLTVTSQSCQTAFCVAGWACALTNPGFTFDDCNVYQDDEFIESVWAKAQDLLGLSVGQAEDLFAADNSLTDIKSLVTRITGIKFEE